MYNPCYNCPRPNVIRVNEGREAILPKDGGDYYDPLVCLSHSGKKKGEKNHG